MIVSWPKRIKAANQIRSQWHHVIDVAPTVLEAASLPEPKSVNGVVQAPIEGVSMVYTFDIRERPQHPQDPVLRDHGQSRASTTTAGSPAPFTARRGSRSPAASCRRTSGSSTTRATTSAWSNDLAASNPAKLKELQDLFMKEATKYRVLPIDDRVLERLNAASAGRPDLMGDRTSLTLSEGMVGMSENVFINIKNRSFSINADVEIPAGRSERRDPGPGGPVRRLEPVSEGRQADVLLQLPRAAAIQGLGPAGAGGGQGHRPHELRLRRRRGRQGRNGHPPGQRQPGRQRPDRTHAGDDLLGRRDGGRGHG